MPINLSKGQKVSLSKGNPGLKKIMVGLGWDVNAFDSGSDFDSGGETDSGSGRETQTETGFRGRFWSPSERRNPHAGRMTTPSLVPQSVPPGAYMDL